MPFQRASGNPRTNIGARTQYPHDVGQGCMTASHNDAGASDSLGMITGSPNLMMTTKKKNPASNANHVALEDDDDSTMGWFLLAFKKARLQLEFQQTHF